MSGASAFIATTKHFTKIDLAPRGAWLFAKIAQSPLWCSMCATLVAGTVFPSLAHFRQLASSTSLCRLIAFQIGDLYHERQCQSGRARGAVLGRSVALSFLLRLPDDLQLGQKANLKSIELRGGAKARPTQVTKSTLRGLDQCPTLRSSFVGGHACRVADCSRSFAL